MGPPEVLEGSGGPLEVLQGSGGVGRALQKSGSGQEDPRSPVGVGRGREGPSEVQERLGSPPEVREGLEWHPGSLEVVGRALGSLGEPTEVRDW